MNNTVPYASPEIWGGMECTINRTRDGYRDQLAEAGHYTRCDDLKKICALGFTKFRYPILWERHFPFEEKTKEWEWTAGQLAILRKNKIDVIAGLVHHGSGPAHTDLSDLNFPEQLAAYAKQVATVFPWIRYYTPVNEPLTTARFSGLYGLWYPHEKNDAAFARMLINQLKGIVLSMKAIREINPAALLVQTEDLSKTHSTPLLSYQANFENDRRWITNDFLTGKVTRQHWAWNYLRDHGIHEDELKFFLENTCPPDIMGFNYYVTSERYLDENTDRYPGITHGHNGIHTYADTEAVRIFKMEGAGNLLTEAWWRYKIPLALTECQLNCTREQQMRWFYQHLQTARRLSRQGIPVTAVTAWGLLGTMDWENLLTRNDQQYEPGVYSANGPALRSTALAPMIQSLGQGEQLFHPALDGRGWWERPRPLAFDQTPAASGGTKKKLLILGSNGTLGAAFCRLSFERGLHFTALTDHQLDIMDMDKLRASIAEENPWAVVNAGSYNRLDDAEKNPELCFKVNASAPAAIASVCKQLGVQFLHFSTDMVFDGSKHVPYIESDPVRPINVYGKSKAEGEQAVLEKFTDSLIVRTGTAFSAWDKSNFAEEVLHSLRHTIPLYIPGDITVSPTYTPDLVNASLDLLIDRAAGIWHIANRGQITWFDFAQDLAARYHKNSHSIVERSQHEMGWAADRPAFSALRSDQGISLPRLENAIERFFHHVKS